MERQKNIIALSQIDFGNRLRTDYGDLEELAGDIKEVGLIHPVTLIHKSVITGEQDHLLSLITDNAPYLLVAGGRRYTAWKEHNLGDHIPCYIYPKPLSPYEIRKIELMENLSRKELSWNEEVAMTDAIHSLEVSQKGLPRSGGQSEGHTIRDTAILLSKSKSTVQNNLDIASALKVMPELSKLKKKGDVLKFAQELRKNDLASKKSQRLKTSKKAELLTVANSYIVGDFFEKAEKLKPKQFDFIEIDPPYAINLKKIKSDSEHRTTDYNEILDADYPAFMRRTFAHAKRLIKPGGWIINWLALAKWYDLIKECAEENNFSYDKLPGLWTKPNGHASPMKRLASCYETFLYMSPSASSTFHKGGQPNVFAIPPVYHEKKIHSAQRPILLMESLLETFIKPGSKVLVPFAGSGVTLRACWNLGYHAIGYDLSETSKQKHDALVFDLKEERFTL